MNSDQTNEHVLEALYKTIESRRGDDPTRSNTAKLFKKGRGKICKKVGEEAVEVVIAALHESKKHVVSESSDLLYHLLVLWAEAGIDPNDVWTELGARVGISGIDEKNNRPKEN